MLFNNWIGFVVAATIPSVQAVRLLLPGFQERQLEASILAQVCEREGTFEEGPGKQPNESQNEKATTFMVTCPQTVAPSACGISEGGMTAIAARNYAELRHVNEKNRFVTSIHLQLSIFELTRSSQYCLRVL